ncbi:hypothetical protein SARC_18312, partial [Sphaeroforma arctica JP610]
MQQIYSRTEECGGVKAKWKDDDTISNLPASVNSYSTLPRRSSLFTSDSDGYLIPRH